MKDAYLYPAYTLQERAGKPGGGKGALIQINKTGSLQTHCGNDRCVFQPIGVDMYNQTLTGDKSKTMSSRATDSDHIPCAIVPLEGNGSRPSHLGGGTERKEIICTH